MRQFPRQKLPALTLPDDGTASDPIAVLIDRARSIPNQLLLDSAAGQVSYAEVMRFTRGIAHRMRADGVRPGQLVALDLPPSLHFPFMMATFHEAAVASAYSEASLRKAEVTPDWLFSMRNSSTSAARHVVKVDDSFIADVAGFEGWLAPTPYRDRGAPCILFMSSGTTGIPKATALSVSNLMGRSHQIARLMATQPYMSMLDVSAYVGQTTFMAQLLMGQTYVVPGRAAENLAAIRRCHVRYVQGSVQQLAGLIRAFREEASQAPLTVEAVQVVGSHMPKLLQTQIQEVLGCAVHARYGTTEGGLASFRLHDSGELFDAGLVAEGVDVEVVGDDGLDAPFGVEGLLRYRGPFTVLSYNIGSTSTSVPLQDGWFYPGDRGRLFADGRLLVTGRDGEAINFGGQKISPALIDEFLLQLDHIIDAAAFASVDAFGVQQLAVALVGDGLDVADVERHLASEFGALAPRRVYEVDQIPRTEMGKPMRTVLTERFSN